MPTTLPATLAPVIEAIDAGFENSVARLTELLTIPSISTDPAHDADTHRAVPDWIEISLSLGFVVDALHDVRQGNQPVLHSFFPLSMPITGLKTMGPRGTIAKPAAAIARNASGTPSRCEGR